MENQTMNMLTLLVFLFAAVERLVWSQYMYCPAQDWTLGSTITLRCYLPREDVHSNCTGAFTDSVTFKRRPFTWSPSDRCTVNNITTASCSPSSSECGCQPANSTHFIAQYTFTVDADDDGTWECSVVCINDNFLPGLSFTSDNCDNREVVAHAVLSTPNITVTTPDTGSGWTVRGTVDITRIFSSTGHYSCMWSYRRDSGQYTDITSSTITTDPPASGTSVRTGQCGFPDRPLPSDPGTYTYRVTVSPGQTVKTDSVVIETPVISSRNCNPSTGYVAENGEVTCTCNANVGRPAGRLRWFMESTTGTTAIKDGQYGDGTLTVRQTVNRNHHGNKLRCEVDWITDITGPDFTLQVAWGPDTVSIQGDNPFYTDTTGSMTLTLTCQATEVNPSPDLTYQWSIPCDATQQNTCSFKPRPPGAGDNGDDNKVITCTVTNVHNNNKKQQGSITLDLKYPPQSSPLIGGYVNNQILYQGDSLILTCTITGGDPMVHSVSLTCLGQHEQDPTNGQSISLVISSLNDSDNNLECVCRGHWVNESYYTLTESRTLTVYSPPSSPVISQTDGQSYPPLEGDTVTLTCSLTSPGHPSARITWPSEGPAVNAIPLQLSVDRGDNQRDVTCQASNEFTQHKGLELRDDFTLHVYYGPDVTFSPAAGNKCIMTSDRTSCSVVEGERLHLQCEVDSNPDPNDCIWSVPSGSDIDLVSGPDLDIVSVNRTHSGVYQVQVETTKPDNRDDRLPLRAHSNLTVLVKSTRDDGGVDAVAIGAGIAAAVLVIVVVAVVVFLIRKRRKQSKAPRRGHNTHHDEPEMIVNDLYGRSPGTADDDQETMIVNDSYESSGNIAPRVTASGGASGGAYEEVSVDKGTNGVTKVQQQPGPSGAGADNVYAEVKKPKKSKKSTPPVAAPADETANVYAVVAKKQGKLDMSPRTAEPGPSARPKPTPKPKTKKGKQNKTSGQRAQEAEGAEYGNIAPLPRAANQAEGSVCGDNGFQKDGRNPVSADALHARSEVPQAAQDDDGSRMVNADGLVYTTVAFTDSQRQKEKEPVAEREFTEYSGIDFTKMAAETKKK